ncbi:MAG: hypothetical protein ACKVH8_05325 [Pirellulales bacterium]
MSLLEGKKSNDRQHAFSEVLDAQSATDARYRYIISQGVEILYDHQTDPWEMKNVATKSPEITERMRQAVQQWMKNSGTIHPPKTF